LKLNLGFNVLVKFVGIDPGFLHILKWHVVVIDQMKRNPMIPIEIGQRNFGRKVSIDNSPSIQEVSDNRGRSRMDTETIQLHVLEILLNVF
jgi:hypothetical protein